MISHSQFEEDKWIVDNLNIPEHGTFCEVGAFDGLGCSNTLYFEEIGWRGVLIEADPYNAAKCFINRPDAVVWCCAVGKERLGLFHVNELDRGASGICTAGKPMPVVVRPLYELLNHSMERPLDLLSIDTEGTELDVWGSIGFISPKIVIIEYQTFFNPSQAPAILKAMEKDYEMVHQTGCNLIMVKRDD